MPSNVPWLDAPKHEDLRNATISGVGGPRCTGLANAITANQLYSIACQLYSEMVSFGYTSVAEFHYLHGSDSGPDRSLEMFSALERAAGDSGIRLTLCPNTL